MVDEVGKNEPLVVIEFNPSRSRGKSNKSCSHDGRIDYDNFGNVYCSMCNIQLSMYFVMSSMNRRMATVNARAKELRAEALQMM